ncbi:purine/pyrimidine phosphoribosyltransferase [Helicobacter fennelliae]|uniref:Purine/pyrimidine phosphoribosyltransferase n=1 Tax=Helicobacter fennelliae TaxID=215 RepID=A0A2X3ERA4_9HELI|nr:hypothetical protein [Helicobacter fennelliae]SQC36255.1 purine/pyrimidine phosphoribosyltransferase [Helicobacter fennelliae]
MRANRLSIAKTTSAICFYSAKAKDVMIVDDIITTGTSFGEAIDVCQRSGARVHFGIALCDARSAEVV